MKHYSLTTSAIFRFLLFSFLLLWGDVGWGQTAECGIYQKLGGIPQGYRGPVISDRFGNQFTLQEVQEGASVECTDSGIFDLHYISNSAGGFSAAEMSTICTVFKQVSDLIAPGNTSASIRINIARFAPGDNDPLAFASGLYTEECGLLNSNILQILQTGVNPLGNGVAAGYIHVRPTPPGSNTWYTTENETDPVGAPPSSVGGTQYDLHSVILHEVGHLLGFASRIGQSGAPLSGNGYSVWDSYLSANGHPLVLSDTDPEAPCCDAHLFNYSFFPNMPDPLNTGCGNNVKFIHPAVSQSPPINSTGVNVTTDGQMANKLSHLAADCPGGANFVMHATFNTGEVRRGFTSTEQQILCALGYSGGMSCGSNAGCQPVANDDAALFILSGTGASPTPYVVDVLANDAPATGTVSLVADCGDLPNLPSGMTVTVTTGGLQINSPQPGTWTFCYLLTSTCAGITRCDEAVATVVIRQNAVPTTGCAGCNLVCFGDFEDFEPGLAGGGVFFPSYYFDQLGIQSQLFNFNGNPSPNSPDVMTQPDQSNNTLITMISGTEINGNESIAIPLREPIQPGCQMTIRFRSASSTLSGLTVNNSTIRILGINGYGCGNQQENRFNEECYQIPSQICSNGANGVTGICVTESVSIQEDADAFLLSDAVNIEGLTLSPVAPVIYTNPASNLLPITHLIIYPNLQSENIVTYFFLDDLTVTSSCQNQISVSSTVLEQCAQPGEVQLAYEVCLDPAGNGSISTDVTLVPDLPAGTTVTAGGCFASNGTGTVNLSTNNGEIVCQICTLTVQLPINYAAGDAVTLGLRVVPETGFCANLDNSTTYSTITLDDCGPIDPPDNTNTLCACPEGATEYTVGSSPFSVRLLSQTNLPANLEGACIRINGTLHVDQNWDLAKSHVILGTGAEILVHSGAKLSAFHGTTWRGCQTMWKSITVQSGGAFISDGSEDRNLIRDAQYGILALDGATLQVQATDFDRNYTHVRVPPTDPAGGLQGVTLLGSPTFGDCVFDCTGSLFPAYPDQTPDPGNRTLVAFDLNDVVGFNIGALDESVLTIQNLKNGIFAQHSDFSVQGALMRDFNAGSSGGDRVGVQAKQCLNAVVERCVIEDFLKGVDATASNLRVLNNQFQAFAGNGITQQDVAVFTYPGTGKLTQILDNEITKAEVGIAVTGCLTPLKNSRIGGNHVTDFELVANSQYLRPSGICLIDVQGLLVYENSIGDGATGDQHRGIYLFRCRGNHLQSNHTYSMKRGFDLVNAQGNYLVNNEALRFGGQGADQPVEGFVNVLGSNRFCCNSINSMSGDGFRFEYQCPATVFSQSQINSAAVGLRIGLAGIPGLSNSTEIGVQNNQKNKWLGSYSGSFGARHESNDIAKIILSRFLTPSSLTPIWTTGAGSNVGWFSPIPSTGSTNYCNCPVINIKGDEARPASSDSLTAVSGHDTPFPATYNWAAQRDLYRRLSLQYDSVAAGKTEVATFYNQVDTTKVGLYGALEMGIRALLEGADYQKALQSQTDVMGYWSDSLRALQTSKAPVEWEQEKWQGVANRLRRDLLEQATLYDAALADVATRQTRYAAALLDNNATLPTDGAAYLKAEKNLNAFYLEHELWRKPNRPLSDVEGVRSIADQCPLSFGPVVYAARTVYLLAGYHWSSDWDDDARICSEEEERGLTVSQMSEIVWSAVPNPANNRVSLLSGRVLTQPAEIRCYNVTGQLVQTLALPAGSQQIELQVAQWPAGLYFFMVVGTRQETVAGKFSIQH